MLVDMSHVPLALLDIAARRTQCLESRLDPPADRIAAWMWPPVSLVLGGLVLLAYRGA